MAFYFNIKEFLKEHYYLSPAPAHFFFISPHRRKSYLSHRWVYEKESFSVRINHFLFLICNNLATVHWHSGLLSVAPQEACLWLRIICIKHRCYYTDIICNICNNICIVHGITPGVSPPHASSKAPHTAPSSWSEGVRLGHFEWRRWSLV